MEEFLDMEAKIASQNGFRNEMVIIYIYIYIKLDGQF